MLAMAKKQVYPNGVPAEGIVIRPVEEGKSPLGDRLSFKVINPLYKD
jgi:hypothetical protein